MKNFHCGNIYQDNVMIHCVKYNIVLQKDQFELGYNWAANKKSIHLQDIITDDIYSNIEIFFYGIRVSISENNLTERDLKIFYQHKKDNINILYDSNGYILDWRDGMFDEDGIALAQLFKLERNKRPISKRGI